MSHAAMESCDLPKQTTRSLKSPGSPWPARPRPLALDTSGAELVPGWLARLSAIAWRILVAVALVVLGGLAPIELSIVTGAILVALIVTAVVYPLVQQLRDRGWPRARAAGAVSVLALVVVVAHDRADRRRLHPLRRRPHPVRQRRRDPALGRLVSRRRVQKCGPPERRPRLVADLSGVANRRAQLAVAPDRDFVTILILGGFLTFYLLEERRPSVGEHDDRNIDDWRAEQLTGRGQVALEQVGGYLRGTAVLAAPTPSPTGSF